MVVAVVKKAAVFTAILFAFSGVKAETISYAIKLGGFKIGSLNTTHIRKGNIDYYSVISNVEVNLIFKIKVYYKTVSIYNNNQLIESKVSSNVNGNSYASNTIWDGQKYKIDCSAYKYSYSDSSRTEPIYWSVSKLYFEKPDVGAEIYAETYGRFSEFKKGGNNQFQVEVQKSKQIYYYDNSLLGKVEMINSIKNFEIERNS
ncbi:MAG: DUF6134 family protein [Bacteroidia bacterium]